MVQVAEIGGDISPKSVVASGKGLFFAQNMMYRHTVTVYDRSFQLVATIPDTVVLSNFGHAEFQGEFQGAPVEAAFTSDGRYAYVSNYSMYGPGFARVRTAARRHRTIPTASSTASTHPRCKSTR